MSISKALYSSRSEEWETPQDFFDKLNEQYHFELDACATPNNAKCKNFFTKKEDALSQNWGGGEQSGAIHLMGVRLGSGCGKPMRKAEKGSQLFVCFLRGLIQDGFTIIARKARWSLCEGV